MWVKFIVQVYVLLRYDASLPGNLFRRFETTQVVSKRLEQINQWREAVIVKAREKLQIIPAKKKIPKKM